MTDEDRRFISIARALALVETRLREDLDVGAMAEAACYSLFHFVRVFTELTGHGPYDYLMRRRVAEAAEAVVGGSRSIIDIALDFRFESPDGFSRAFRRCLGVVPSEARRRGSYPARSIRTPIDEEYTRRLRAAKMTVSVETRPDIVVAGSSVRPGVSYRSDGETVAVRASDDETPLFVGRVLGSGEAPPPFPIATVAVPGGPAFVVSASGVIDVDLAREYLYRTVLPVSGSVPRGDCELLGLDAAGRAVSFRVPLVAGI